MMLSRHVRCFLVGWVLLGQGILGFVIATHHTGLEYHKNKLLHIENCWFNCESPTQLFHDLTVILCYDYQQKIMKFWKKTFPFLILNIVVSATTMFTVLSIWQHRNPSAVSQATITPIASAELKQGTVEVPAPTNKPEVEPEGSLSIEGVFGAGDLNVEYILIRNKSEGSVDLTNWSISGSDGNRFVFSLLNLNKNGAVRLYSKHGTNTVIELYWNSDQALWESGDHIYLIDGSGQQHASWLVP